MTDGAKDGQRKCLEKVLNGDGCARACVALKAIQTTKACSSCN